MKIEIERGGGYAGRLLRATVDAASLSPKEVDELRQLVEQSGFFSLPPQLAAPAPLPDSFHYRVTVESADGKHTVEVDDDAAPPRLRALLDRLTDLARQSKKN
jgi:hypothetical protein